MTKLLPIAAIPDQPIPSLRVVRVRKPGRYLGPIPEAKQTNARLRRLRQQFRDFRIPWAVFAQKVSEVTSKKVPRNYVRQVSRSTRIPELILEVWFLECGCTLIGT